MKKNADYMSTNFKDQKLRIYFQMNSFIYQLLFFIVLYIKSTYNYPNGAPSSTCARMIPDHNVSSEECSTKYRVQSDKLQYYTDETVRSKYY